MCFISGVNGDGILSILRVTCSAGNPTSHLQGTCTLKLHLCFLGGISSKHSTPCTHYREKKGSSFVCPSKAWLSRPPRGRGGWEGAEARPSGPRSSNIPALLKQSMGCQTPATHCQPLNEMGRHSPTCPSVISRHPVPGALQYSILPLVLPSSPPHL